VRINLLGERCGGCVLQQVGFAVKLLIVLMEGSIFPFDEYGGT